MREVVNMQDENQTAQAVGVSKTPEATAPLFVKIIVVLMAFTVIGSFLRALLGGRVIDLLAGIIGLGVIWGLWYMRRWGLYLFTLLTVMLVSISIYLYMTSNVEDKTQLWSSGLQVLFLIYLWSIAR